MDIGYRSINRHQTLDWPTLDCTRTPRDPVPAILVRNTRKVLMLRLLGHSNGTPKIQVIVCFFKVFGPSSEKPRIRRYHDAINPAWKENQKHKTDVSREKGLKNPERVRVKYVSEKAKGQNKAGCKYG